MMLDLADNMSVEVLFLGLDGEGAVDISRNPTFLLGRVLAFLKPLCLVQRFYRYRSHADWGWKAGAP